MAERLTLIGGKVFTGAAAGVLDEASIFIEGGNIVAVRPMGSSAALPEDADVIDVRGQTVLPGLIDAHVHLASGGSASPEARREALVGTMQSLVDAGVTTVRDLGAIGRDLFSLREAARAGELTAPRLVLCGQVISAVCPGAKAFPGMYRETTGPDDIRAAAREQAEGGADVVKVMSTGALTVAEEEVGPAQLSYEELAAVVGESHRLGLPVASHAEGAEGIRLSVMAGTDTVEHGEEAHLLPPTLAEMAARGVVLVPTLSVFHYVAESDHFPEWMRARAQRLGESAHLSVEAARREGVDIAMGADAPPQGDNAQELVRLADAGLSAEEAISSATRVAARACRVDHLVGTVEEGKVADLIVVDGDPLSDVRILADRRRLSLVLQAGAVVSGRQARLA